MAVGVNVERVFGRSSAGVMGADVDGEVSQQWAGPNSLVDQDGAVLQPSDGSPTHDSKGTHGQCRGVRCRAALGRGIRFVASLPGVGCDSTQPCLAALYLALEPCRIM